MTGPAIVSRTYAALTLDRSLAVPVTFSAARPGEIVETDDGQRWFHPYSGEAPIQLADATQEA